MLRRHPSGGHAFVVRVALQRQTGNDVIGVAGGNVHTPPMIAQFCTARATPHAGGWLKPSRASHSAGEMAFGIAPHAGRIGSCGPTSSTLPSQLKSWLNTPGAQFAAIGPPTVAP